MILLTNGCSWTWGGGLNLNDYENHTHVRKSVVWPAHLGKLLKAEEVVQLAMGCGSNQRILRTTLDWILSQNLETLNKTVAIIQWTEFSRYEYYNSENFSNLYENYSERWALAKSECIIDKYETNYKKSMTRLNSRLETYTEIEGLYRNIFECAALDSIFKRYNIKYYYWKFSGYTQSPPVQLTTFLDSFNWLKNSDSWDYERVSLDDNHPGIIGHKQIADIIYEEIWSDIT